MSDREQILAAVREATASAAVPPVPRAYGRGLDEGTDLRALFIDRLHHYDAEVYEVADADLPRVIGEVLGKHRITSLVVPADLPREWLTTVPGRVLADDPPLPVTELDTLVGVLTTSAVGIANTGTIILDGGPRQGRRAISLVPDVHVCLVYADTIVGSVPEGIARLEDPTRPLTWISGPSATSDVELERVRGVHGPRTLVVLLVG